MFELNVMPHLHVNQLKRNQLHPEIVRNKQQSRKWGQWLKTLCDSSVTCGGFLKKIHAPNSCLQGLETRVMSVRLNQIIRSSGSETLKKRPKERIRWWLSWCQSPQRPLFALNMFQMRTFLYYWHYWYSPHIYIFAFWALSIWLQPNIKTKIKQIRMHQFYETVQ